MTNLWILLKNDFNIMMGKLQGKKKRVSTLASAILLFVLFGAVAASMIFQAWTMFEQFVPLGLSKMIVFHSLTLVVTIVVTIGVMRITINTRSNDEWLLLSSPIKKRDVVIAKLINRYLFDFAFVSLMLLPFVVIYLIQVEFSARFLVLGVVLTFTLPLLSVGISNCLGFVISKLFNRFKCASLIKSFISILLFVVVYGLLIIKTSSYGLVEAANMEDFFADRPITNLLLEFLMNPNVANAVLIALMVLVPFIVGAVLYGINYGSQSVGYRSKSTRLKFNNANGLFKSVFIKELNTYATTPAFVANTIIGPVLMVGFAIMMATTGDVSGLGFIMGLIPTKLVSGLFALLFGLFASMTVISACTISLEGKNLWVLKSNPIDEKLLFLAKALLQMVVVLPFLVVSVIIVGISFDFALVDYLMVGILPTLVCVCMSFMGVLINLWLPMLEWDDETKVVKQSMAVLIAMFGGMFVALIPLLLYELLEGASILVLFGISSAIIVALTILAVVLLFTVGVKKFQNME